MRVILSCGSAATPGTVSRASLRAFDPDQDDQQQALAELGGIVTPVIASGGAVVALFPAWADDPCRRWLQAVRSALDTTRLVLHPCGLPPLAAASLAELLADLAADERVEVADLVRALPALERRTIGAAWLGSVAKLRHPAPTLGLHARSWLRNSSFGAIVDDRPRVVTLGKGREEMPLPPADPAGWQVTVAIGEGDLTRVERALARRAGGAPVSKVPVGATSRGWWGTEKLIELAFRPADLDGIVRELVASRPDRRCRWCEEPVADDLCPFCAMRQPPAASAAPTGGIA